MYEAILPAPGAAQSEKDFEKASRERIRAQSSRFPHVYSLPTKLASSANWVNGKTFAFCWLATCSLWFSYGRKTAVAVKAASTSFYNFVTKFDPRNPRDIFYRRRAWQKTSFSVLYFIFLFPIYFIFNFYKGKKKRSSPSCRAIHSNFCTKIFITRTIRIVNL